MSTRGPRFPSKRRLTAIALSITGLVAVLAVVGVLVFNTRTAHGSGTGGGGCFNVSGPACTFKGNSSFNDFGTVSSAMAVFSPNPRYRSSTA